jgi:hypothetical protein
LIGHSSSTIEVAVTKQDLRFAWRALSHSPALSLVIILSIALGIAANTTVFSVANGLLWGLLPVKDPGRLVMFSEGNSFPFPDYLDYRDQTANIFEDGITAHFPIIPASVGGTGGTRTCVGPGCKWKLFLDAWSDPATAHRHTR